jgi:hypothetical protein
VLERVLETWLDKANERSFQVPFCHSLAFEGYKVIHMSRHCGMELGKDILAIAPDGTPCAYQLKGVNGGKLTLGKWRDDLEKQMYALAMGQVVHPSISTKKPHRSYLVINGEFDEEVSRAIDDFNAARSRERNRHLRIYTIVKGELLDRFKRLQTDLWPTELSDTKTFLELFLETGKSSLPRPKLASLFESVLPFSKGNGKAPSQQQCARSIASCAILCSTAISSFSNANNHVAEFEAWTLYLAYVLALAERWKLPQAQWRVEADLAMEAIYTALGRLCDELTARRDYIEGHSLAEMAYHSIFLRIRLTYLLGLMSIYALWRRIRKETEVDRDSFLREFCLKNTSKLFLWGEHAAPQILAFYLFYRIIDAGMNPDMLLLTVIKSITAANAPSSQLPLANPYYTVEAMLPYLVGFADEPLEDHFNEASFSLEAFVHLFVRRNWKQAMQTVWPETTRIMTRRFKPMNKWGSYYWRCERGHYEEIAATPNQKWDELRRIASEHSGRDVPRLMKDFPIQYLCFLCVFPHRLHANGIRWLASRLDELG